MRPTPPSVSVRRPLLVGAGGSLLLTLGGFGAAGVPVGGGPAAALGIPGAMSGHGLVLSMAAIWSGVALLLGAWLALGPRAVRGGLSTVDAAWLVAVWCVPLTPSVPLFSRDAWSYLAQGAMLGHAVSPYDAGPSADPGVYSAEVAPDWRNTVTPYGPLQLLVARALVSLGGHTPWVSMLLLRVVVFAAVAALCVGVVRLAAHTGTDPGAALWATGACPLLVVHIAGGLHNEILALVPTLFAVVAALDGRRWRAAVCVGLALSVKVTVVVVAPFLLWLLLARRRERRDRDASAPRGARASVAATATDVLALAVVPPAVTVVFSWVTGTGSGWLRALDVSDRVVNYLSVPTAVAHLVAPLTSAGFDTTLAVARLAGRVVLALVLVALWWTHRRGSLPALRGMVLALVAFLLLNTVAWPWYHLWPAVLWFAARPPVRATVAATVAVTFLLLVIGPNGSTSLYTPVLVAVALVVAAGVALWWRRALRAST